jgi:hypothetical protein
LFLTVLWQKKRHCHCEPPSLFFGGEAISLSLSFYVEERLLRRESTASVNPALLVQGLTVS